MSFTQALATNNYGPAKFIVASNPANGTHTTIQSAINAASSGDTIAIRPGTYTENPALKTGVNLVAYGPSKTEYANSSTIPNVIISGKCTYSSAGTVGIYGINLQTNSDYALEITGSAASNVVINNCFINCTNNAGIHLTSSSASSQIALSYCGGDLGTTGIGLFTHTGAGNLRFLYSNFSNSGTSLTASTVSGSGGLFPNYAAFANGITVSSTATMNGNNNNFVMSGNQTALTYNSTGTAGNLQNSTFTSGTSSAVSIGAGASLAIHYALVSSSNANPLTGSGTLTYTDIVFNSTVAIDNNLLRAPFPSTNAWTFIQTLTASASATLSFTTGIGSPFTQYMLIWSNVIAASGGGQALELLYNQGSGFVASGYSGNGVFANTAAGPATIATVTTYAVLGTAVGSAAPACSGSCLISNALFGGSVGATYHTSGSNERGSNGIGVYGGTFGNTAAVTQLQVKMASGNISTGSFTLYGIMS